MNEIRRIETEAEEIARVRAIMNRFPLPDFVADYTIELGFFHDEPSLWVRFQTELPFPESQDEMIATGKQLAELVNGAHVFLREYYPERYPYFRFPDSGGKVDKRG